MPWEAGGGQLSCGDGPALGQSTGGNWWLRQVDLCDHQDGVVALGAIPQQRGRIWLFWLSLRPPNLLGPVVPHPFHESHQPAGPARLGLCQSPEDGEMVLSLLPSPRSPFLSPLLFERPKERSWMVWGPAGMGGAASLDPPVMPMWDQTPPDRAPQTSWRTCLGKHTHVLPTSLFICF